MKDKLKIGIVGCGAIGSSLAKVIFTEFSQKAQLCALYDKEVEKAYKLASYFNNQKLASLSLEDLINHAKFVIEATTAESVFKIAKEVILASRDVMIMSVGGILGHYKDLQILAEEKNVRIFIPSGAICGIDGLKAASCGKINKVILITKKPPRAFLGVPYVLKRNIRLDKINTDTVIFEGDVFAATRLFPQNINVAATLSLVGIGSKDTLVRIIACPSIDKNIHEIEIDSDSGKIFIRTENLPHPDNPKTSYLAVLSAIATLRQILGPIRIGT